MIYLSVQPDIRYFHWQVEVYLTNFINIGINPNKIEVIFMHQGSPSPEAIILQQKYNTVRFFFYLDDRPDKAYIPSIKPYGLFKHIQVYPELNTEPIFYHDSDIIFREKINEDLFINDDVWYLSDTISYIGYDYCISKGLDQFLDMVDLVRVGREDVKSNQISSGGAQYIVKETRAAFWYKVYEDSNYLYNIMSVYEQKNTADTAIQKWCAEMWATLWNAWLFRYKTVIHDELKFCFGTDNLDNWYATKIMHNAGVTKDRTDLFFKGGFTNESPFSYNLNYVDPNTTSFKYVEAILNVKSKL